MFVNYTFVTNVTEQNIDREAVSC